MLAALEGGKIDAVLLDMPLAVATAERFARSPASGRTAADTETIVAALPKGSNNTEAVDSAMRAFTADGTMHHLLATWVGSAAADAESSIPLLHTTL